MENIPAPMKSVSNIISAVFGSATLAAKALNVGLSAVSNWKSRGHFPPRLLPQILSGAAAAGVVLPIGDIPIAKAAT